MFLDRTKLSIRLVLAAAAFTACTHDSGVPIESERPFVLLKLAPTQSDLVPLLREHVGRAKSKGLKPFVEVYANWCKPCVALQQQMNDERMIEAFKGTYIVKLNVDDWEDQLRSTGFVPVSIPVFYGVSDEGRPTGRSLRSDVWGPDTPEEMAPPLKAFFQE